MSSSFTLYNLLEKQSLNAYTLNTNLTSPSSAFSVEDINLNEILSNSYLTEKDSGIISSNIVPSENNIYNLGSPTQQFNTVYLSSNSLIIGSIPLSSDENSLIIGTPEQDVSLIIPSGKLDIQEASIVAYPDGNLELPASTTIDGTLPGTIHILNIFNNISSLPNTANLGDAYIIAASTDIPGDLYVCTDNVQLPNIFTNIGPVQGPDGKQGPQGLEGPQGTQNGLFTLIVPPTIGTTNPNSASIASPNSIKSAAGQPGGLWNGRVQSLTGYNNTPFYLSFTIPPPALQPPASAAGYCVVGVSSDPGNANTNDYNGYFNAGFVIQQSTFQLVVNKSGTPSAPSIGSSNVWTNNSTFIIIFDGYYFNFYITNQSTELVGETLQVFSYPAPVITTIDSQINYYFTASFAGGAGGYTTTFLVSNIVFSPYALLNPRNYYGNTINNNMWTNIPGEISPIMQVNNTFLYVPFTNTQESMISSNSYGSILNYNAATRTANFSTPLEGFVFSIVAPETYGQGIIVRISGGPDAIVYGRYVQNMSINLNNYIAAIQFPKGGGGNTTRFNYNVGDVITVYYNPANNVSNLYLYINQSIVLSSIFFAPTNKCKVTIKAFVPGGGAFTTPIVVSNPLFYKYGNLALHL
jgi:hypothetical protein